jgi:hypothetical protein
MIPLNVVITLFITSQSQNASQGPIEYLCKDMVGEQLKRELLLG